MLRLRRLPSRKLAVEWARDGTNVNAIAPGVFRTDLNAQLLDGTERGRELKMRTPMGRFGQPEELVGAAVLLASDAASLITGQCIAVDGGFLALGVNGSSRDILVTENSQAKAGTRDDSDYQPTSRD